MNLFDLASYIYDIDISFEGDSVEYFDYLLTFKSDSEEHSKRMERYELEDLADELQKIALKIRSEINHDC